MDRLICGFLILRNSSFDQRTRFARRRLCGQLSLEAAAPAPSCSDSSSPTV